MILVEVFEIVFVVRKSESRYGLLRKLVENADEEFDPTQC